MLPLFFSNLYSESGNKTWYKKALDKEASAIFKDLSKVFDTINHGFLLAELQVYSFSTLSNYTDDNNLFTTGTDIQLINQMLLYTFTVVTGFMRTL